METTTAVETTATKPKLTELAKLYHSNRQGIEKLRQLGVVESKTIAQLDTTERNNFIVKYGLETFLHYLTHESQTIIELDGVASVEQQNEAMLNHLAYFGSSTLAKIQLEQIQANIAQLHLQLITRTSTLKGDK